MTLRRWSVARLFLALALCAPLTACQPESSTTQSPQKDKNVPTKDGGASPTNPKNDAPTNKSGDASKPATGTEKSR